MDEEIRNNFFKQAVDIWINPEVIKRQRRGWKEKEIWAAQIILSATRKPLVRLNEQINLKIKTEEGLIVEGANIKNIDSKEAKVLVLDDSVKDTANVYLILFKQDWTVKFDFRYYRDTAKEHVSVAKEFFESAKENLAQKRFRPFYEECWTVAELLSACNFLLTGFKYDNHYKNLEYMKSWANLGNVKLEFSETLQKLWNLRSSARYLKSKDFEKEDHIKYVKILEEMFEFVEKAIR